MSHTQRYRRIGKICIAHLVLSWLFIRNKINSISFNYFQRNMHSALLPLKNDVDVAPYSTKKYSRNDTICDTIVMWYRNTVFVVTLILSIYK